MSELFKVGDKVEIINNGCSYGGYDEMAETLGAKNWLRGSPPQSNNVCRRFAIIKAIGVHDGIRIALIDMNGRDFLMGLTGLLKVEANHEQHKK